MDASKLLRKPLASDDKYSRGVVGFVTGSEAYPGAAILGVTAAIRTGIGMIRYLGPGSVSNLVLEVRPEVVIQPGRVDAWVLGSGVDSRDSNAQVELIKSLAQTPELAVIDAGAIEIIDFQELQLRAVLTPHAGELSRLFSRLGQPKTREEIEANPVAAAELAAKLTGQTVLLKGNRSVVASDGFVVQAPAAPAELATAGTGDVLAGILGALIAANADAFKSGEVTLAEVALGAIEIHRLAALKLSAVGPIAALDLANEVQSVVGEILESK